MTDLVLVDISEGVATVTLNDPPKRNAFSFEMRERLLDVLPRLHDDPACRAILLTGGDKAFCSGGDITEMATRTYVQSRARLVKTTDIGRLLLTGPKPIISAVEGSAIGAGLTLVVASDYSIVADNAKLSAAFIKMGLLPDTASFWIYPRRVGLAKAQEIFTLGRMIPAIEAARIGLINEIVEPGNTLQRAREVAMEYASMPPAQMAMLRGAMAEGFSSIEAAVQFEEIVQPLAQRTDDHKEAVAAFKEKRKPVFTGN